MKKALIEFVDFGFQYHAQAEPTLYEVNCTIYEGEKVLILGPSGSGKSSLAHCINGLAPFFYPGEITGSLKIKGQDTRQMTITEISKHVGTVLQDPDGQFVGLTVAEDIAFQLENQAVSQTIIHQKVHDIAQQVHIFSHLDQAPHTLSGGQKQRTTLAGVMIQDVDILLFDEPLANLDPLSGISAIEMIDTIYEHMNKTIMIIEHRLEEVLHRHVDRILVVNEGRIVADLTPDELLSSALLQEIGIREPLYLRALKRAGCSITPTMHPAHLHSMHLEHSHISQLQQWANTHDIVAKEKTKPILLELDQIEFAYEPGHDIIRQLSFHIHEAEMVCIVGNNGAGKSTISKLICGFYYPQAGHIRMYGQDIQALTIRERAEFFGFVLQNPNQMISQPMVFDEVAMGLVIRGLPADEVKDRVYQILKICGLYPYRNWPISALSFGQKKRVTIASILILRPKLLILDEPTAGQDYKHYHEMMNFIKHLHKQGIAILMITHDMHLMMEYAERAIVISEGKVIANDQPAQILSNQSVLDVAHLKQTSLYALAKKSGIESPETLVKRFIAPEKVDLSR